MIWLRAFPPLRRPSEAAGWGGLGRVGAGRDGGSGSGLTVVVLLRERLLEVREEVLAQLEALRLRDLPPLQEPGRAAMCATRHARARAGVCASRTC